jgi:transcriptional regulator with XRE-family HTH domain
MTVSTAGFFIRGAGFFAGARLVLALATIFACARLSALTRFAELALRGFARFCTFALFLRLAMIDPLWSGGVRSKDNRPSRRNSSDRLSTDWFGAPASALASSRLLKRACTVTIGDVRLEIAHGIGDNGQMAGKAKSRQQKTGLYYAREARGMSRTQLVKRSGVSKQQLSRLENGLIRLRLDHLKPFANALGYSPEQILLWGRYPGTAEAQIEGEAKGISERVPELASRSEAGVDYAKLRRRREGQHVERIKAEDWVFPASFITNRLQASAKNLLVIEAEGDAMAPTIMSEDKVVVDAGHKKPSPDGLYAIRDSFENVIVRRLQLLRAAQPSQVKVISDNPKHAAEEVALSEIDIVGKALCCMKLL